MDALGKRPLVVGIGGSEGPGSATERALARALEEAGLRGAEVRIYGGAFLGALPLFRPGHPERTWQARELVTTVARADGIILATPSYHGGVSGMVKNALDYLEDLRCDDRPYLDGRAVGCVVTSAGTQAGGITLAALRAIVHALRGWPTPFGATLDVLPGASAESVVDRDAGKLAIVAAQVVEFARMAGAVHNAIEVAG
ncbi:NAD(P)H-dependent oxidoreductase [Actinoplanes sp. NPDC051475]|uniref:NADPH-dependent FMN reductase n=1 Tax=Actinoplanes sp. NPDC051475 TaxID=3157225 RepID=UPI00344EBA7B